MTIRTTARHRLPALAAALALAGAVLAGCGGQTTESTTASVTGAARTSSSGPIMPSSRPNRIIPIAFSTGPLARMVAARRGLSRPG